MLLRRGGWFDTEFLIKVCIYGCHITWPAFVGTVLWTDFCNGDIQPVNKWWSVIGKRPCEGKYLGLDYNYGAPMLVDDNTAPTLNDITGSTGKYLSYHVVKAQDIGKKITFYGKKYGGQPLQRWTGNQWVNGLELSAQKPFGNTNILVSKIETLTREATQGMSYLYEYDPDTQKRRLLGVYEPNDTNPEFRRSRIQGYCNIPGVEDDHGRMRKWVEALIKVRYVPCVNENDFLIIDNFDALAMCVQSIRHREAHEYEDAEATMLMAIRELNMELRDKVPSNQTAVRVNVTGGHGIYSAI